MKHLVTVSKAPVAVASTTLQIKVDGIIDIIDRILLAQRQAAWKVPYPIDYESNTTDTNTDTNA